MRKMGSSLDWSREAYTMTRRERGGNEMFKMMYEDGLIAAGCRVVIGIRSFKRRLSSTTKWKAKK